MDGVRTSDIEVEGAASNTGFEGDPPMAELVGSGAYRFATKGYIDDFRRSCPSPDVNRMIALQDHVVG